MGYDASGSGCFIKKNNVEIPESVYAELTTVFDEVSDTPDGGLWLIKECDRYDDDLMMEALNKLAPYVKTGSADFIGEDDAQWRIRLDYGNVIYECGEIKYERYCAGYKIIAELPLQKNEALVIGHNPKAVNHYVVWYCNGEFDFNTGAYCDTYDEAMGVIAERIKSNMAWIMKEVV